MAMLRLREMEEVLVDQESEPRIIIPEESESRKPSPPESESRMLIPEESETKKPFPQSLPIQEMEHMEKSAMAMAMATDQLMEGE